MVGLPWSQHVAFLDDRGAQRQHPARTSSAKVAELGDHPAVLTFALGNEIPPGVVRWHGRVRVERFLRSSTKRPRRRRPRRCSPTSTFRRPSFSISRSSTSAPSTSTCTASTSCARIWRGCSTSPARSRCCWPKRAPTASAKGEDGQAEITAMHIRAAFEEGACGAIAFAWTDEWWRGGHPSRGLGVRPGRSRAAAQAGGRRGRRGVRRRRRSRAERAAHVAARLGGRLRLQRRRHARGQSRARSSSSPIRTTRSSWSTTARRSTGDQRDRPTPSFARRSSASSTSPNGGLSARAQRRARRRRPARSSPTPTPTRASIATG